MLRIGSSVEYAMRLMVRLASLAEGGTLSAERLSALENVPRDYVDQLLQRLRRAGLVDSRRGAQGGYRLSKAPSAIPLGRVIKAVDEGVFEAVCDRYTEGDAQCSRLEECGIRPVWSRLGLIVEDYLDKVSLAALLEPETGVSARVAHLFGEPAAHGAQR
ncbi:MAG: Rrf2 family transcriptional regulator [Elusimicrobia bacterium]|nr:Rrf2 family transcriptional regulator [Elusimicrobiota bacterium]